MMQCITVVVKGRVQGVFFRDYTRREAKRLGLSGWVRNLANGDVEALICGDGEDVERMTKWFYQGSPQSRVNQVLVKEARSGNLSKKFEVRF